MLERIERVSDINGRKLTRAYLGAVLFGELRLRPCRRPPDAGKVDLLWRGGGDPKRAIDENLHRVISMCWKLMSMRTGKPLPPARALPLGDGTSWWLCRLAAGGHYRIEDGEGGGEVLVEYYAPAPTKRITRPTA
jgi:hypothetical protein